MQVTEKECTECMTYFRITGDFNPDDISEMLGLSPFETFRKGDTDEKGRRAFNFLLWCFGACREYSPYTDEQMQKTIEPLISKTDILNEIREKFEVAFTLVAVPIIKTDDCIPALAPSLSLMQFCVDTQTELDIDLYVK